MPRTLSTVDGFHGTLENIVEIESTHVDGPEFGNETVALSDVQAGKKCTQDDTRANGASETVFLVGQRVHNNVVCMVGFANGVVVVAGDLDYRSTSSWGQPKTTM